MKTVEYHYVVFSREDWGQLGAGFHPVCFSSYEQAEAYAKQEIVRRLGPEGTTLKLDPRAIEFDGEDVCSRRNVDENAHASYEVTKWTVECVRLGYTCVRFHESVRVTLTQEKRAPFFTGYSADNREGPYQIVRTPDARSGVAYARSGVAYGFTIETVSVDMFDDAAEAAAAQ